MLLDDSEVSERLESEKNLVNIVTLKRNGSGPRTPQLVNDLMVKIAEHDSSKNIAEAFEVDKSEVNKEIKKAGGREETAHDHALDLMVESLKAAKNRMAEVDKPKDLVKIAESASKIVGNLKGKGQEGGTKVQVNVYAPVVKKESDYETINA